MSAASQSIVMAGLVPAIHVLLGERREDVDARPKAGHDEALADQAEPFSFLVHSL
jgi:hypothetical protein